MTRAVQRRGARRRPAGAGATATRATAAQSAGVYRRKRALRAGSDSGNGRSRSACSVRPATGKVTVGDTSQMHDCAEHAEAGGTRSGGSAPAATSTTVWRRAAPITRRQGSRKRRGRAGRDRGGRSRPGWTADFRRPTGGWRGWRTRRREARANREVAARDAERRQAQPGFQNARCAQHRKVKRGRRFAIADRGPRRGKR